MLKKKVASTIIAATRMCVKCNKTVTLSTTSEKTVCECGAVVCDVHNDNDITGETTHEEGKFADSDTSPELHDSE